MEDNKNIQEKEQLEEVKDENQETSEVECQENSEEENKENLEIKEEIIEEMESIVELSTEYDYRAQKYCQMYRMKVKSKSTIMNIVLCVAVLGFAFYWLFSSEGSGKYFSIVLFIWFLYMLYGVIFEEKKIDKFLVKYFRTHPKFTLKYQINNDKIRFYNEKDKEKKYADFDWAYVSEVVKIPEYYFIFLNGGSILVLDRREEVMEKGTQEELDELIKKQCELKPFVVYNKKFVKNLVECTYFEPAEVNTENQEENLDEQNQDNAENKEE